MIIRLSSSRAWILLLLACLALLTGCGRVSRQAGGGAAEIELLGPLVPPPVGAGQLLLRITDEAGRAVDDALLDIRGDMTHAGMTPFFASANRGEDGRYLVPVEWSMAGDWIVTAEVTLSDGSRVSRQFELSVSGEEELCTDE